MTIAYLLALVLAVPVAVTIVRFVTLPAAAKRYWLPARWHALRWHHLARNLKLSREDLHRVGKVACPRARFRPDPFGFVVKLRLTPGVSRPEFERNAEHLANSWGCWRVGITQPKPGRLLVRAIRRDPLAEPLPSGVIPPFDCKRWYLGRDEFAQDRYAGLAGISGSVIGGNPGRGKSQAGASFAVQLAPARNSDWYVLDGGGGADWSCWADRATRFATDDLEEARDVLEEVNARMIKRLATLTSDLGTRNAWTRGPTADYPMLWVPIDESSVYLDLDSAKALGKEAEQHVRAIRTLVMGIMRRGRKCLAHVTLLAQKATSTSIPPDIRDLAGLRLCFGVATTEAGVCVLGDDLREYKSLSPTGLQGDEHVGVCTARLKTGNDPYTRLRVPFVTEDQAAAVAAQFRPVPDLTVVPRMVPVPVAS